MSESTQSYKLAEMYGEMALSLAEGQALFEAVGRDLRSNQQVELDFAGVQVMASAFLNAGIGQLYRDFDVAALNYLVTISNVSPASTHLMNLVLENSKRYLSEMPARVEAVVESIS